MGFVVGLVLALGVGVSATWIGLDRDRALYPVIMVVIASYYALFAIMGGSQQALVVESIVAIAFLAAAIVAFRSTLWLVVVALAAHGVFDFIHGHFINNPGVPAWWPMFCLSYDVAAAGYLAWLVASQRVRGNAT
jgi:hypothetical protein